MIESGSSPAAVVAGAGSGKTETMAARVVWLVANELVGPDEILGPDLHPQGRGRAGRSASGVAWRSGAASSSASVRTTSSSSRGCRPPSRRCSPTPPTPAGWSASRPCGSAPSPTPGCCPRPCCGSSPTAWCGAGPGELPEFGAISSLVHWVIAMSGQFADHLADADAVERVLRRRAASRSSRCRSGKRARSETPNGTGEYVDALRQRRALVPLVREYLQAKQALGAVDFGDQMRAGRRARAASPEVAAVERQRYRAVLLDEYQDTGHAQIEMLRGLFGDGHPVTAVGDPFQSIYGWRGASAGNMGAFDIDLPAADGTPAAGLPAGDQLPQRPRDPRGRQRGRRAAAHQHGDGAAAPARRQRPGHASRSPSPRPSTTRRTGWRSRLRDGVGRAAAGERAPPRCWCGAASQMPVRWPTRCRAPGCRSRSSGSAACSTTPEVVDVVATLRVLGDHTPGGALMRLLTGARWRIGPRDLARSGCAPPVRPPEPVRAAARARPTARPPTSASRSSLVEALDDLGPARAPTRPTGYRRMQPAGAASCAALRRRLAAPLAELVAEVEHAIGVGIEVAARPRPHPGRPGAPRPLPRRGGRVRRRGRRLQPARLPGLPRGGRGRGERPRGRRGRGRRRTRAAADRARRQGPGVGRRRRARPRVRPVPGQGHRHQLDTRPARAARAAARRQRRPARARPAPVSSPARRSASGWPRHHDAVLDRHQRRSAAWPTSR